MTYVEPGEYFVALAAGVQWRGNFLRPPQGVANVPQV